ncbi:uncharacterized protein YkwD [Salirhabdus euzebyi]|uniref:Uncharacterized protein YkwD n=1 Tax=Salirhabdus euzebyi TaxID=394506 RepID=A0A841Q9B7_9BACI|nr:CAP domain-containing protein [Salirhabdus euzebyi]MBB6455000.1 uncharacterized protein YkwD [Salirhabdus euzebyi]
MKRLGIIAVLLFVFYIFMEEEALLNDFIHNLKEPSVKEEELIKDEIKVEQQEKLPSNVFSGDLFELFASSEQKIIDKLGQPNRKDPSPYGYDWWIYEKIEDQYIQIAMENGQSVSVFATGDSIPMSPVTIGDQYEKVMEHFPFEEEVQFETTDGSYQFLLKEGDLKINPLVSLSDDYFIQFYFDTFTNELSSVRLLTSDALLRIKPYAVKYRGDLPKVEDLDEQQWEKVQNGRERQILAISNIIRQRFDLSHLQWENQVSQVAFSHSKDMSINQYFSHFSLNGDGLKERLAKYDIAYRSAGENIAAQYPDAPAAVEGWLNSEGHRKALLNRDYTHLGVGVYRDYYTQNFVQAQ